MSLSIELPHDIETLLEPEVRDLDQSAKEHAWLSSTGRGK